MPGNDSSETQRRRREKVANKCTYKLCLLFQVLLHFLNMRLQQKQYSYQMGKAKNKTMEPETMLICAFSIMYVYTCIILLYGAVIRSLVKQHQFFSLNLRLVDQSMQPAICDSLFPHLTQPVPLTASQRREKLISVCCLLVHSKLT